MTSAASPESPESPASPDSPDSPDSPASPATPADVETDGSDDLAERAAAEPVDTEPLERSRRAIDEGHAAAAKALDSDLSDVDFENVESNDDPEAEGNAVPRPN